MLSLRGLWGVELTLIKDQEQKRSSETKYQGFLAAPTLCTVGGATKKKPHVTRCFPARMAVSRKLQGCHHDSGCTIIENHLGTAVIDETSVLPGRGRGLCWDKAVARSRVG